MKTQNWELGDQDSSRSLERVPEREKCSERERMRSAEVAECSASTDQYMYISNLSKERRGQPPEIIRRNNLQAHKELFPPE